MGLKAATQCASHGSVDVGASSTYHGKPCAKCGNTERWRSCRNLVCIYRCNEARRASLARYKSSEKGRRSQGRYKRSEKGRLVGRRYARGPKGTASQARHELRKLGVET